MKTKREQVKLANFKPAKRYEIRNLANFAKLANIFFSTMQTVRREI